LAVGSWRRHLQPHRENNGRHAFGVPPTHDSTCGLNLDVVHAFVRAVAVADAFVPQITVSLFAAEVALTFAVVDVLADMAEITAFISGATVALRIVFLTITIHQ
jgi:hypothetical protein